MNFEMNESLLQLKSPWTDDELRSAFPDLAEDANKFSRGVLTVIAGSAQYPGAAPLTSRAGQRMGAGYTEVVTAKQAMGIVLAAYPSLVVRDVDAWRNGGLQDAKKRAKRAICIGPGFVAGDEKSEQLVIDVLKRAECPVLVDGGGINVLGSKKAMKALAKRREHGLTTVLTPHGGEAMRLQSSLGMRSDGPAQLATALALATGAVVVMKGPDTYISSGTQTFPMLEGTAALAKAGTGDVLAGMIAALLAQGVEPVSASVLGTTLHAWAGIEAAQLHTPICVTPEDVIEAIPSAVRKLLERESE